MSIVNLRPYQVEAAAAVRRTWRQHREALVVLPTGTGKTVLGLSIAAQALDKGLRVLWLAHRQELLDQPVRTLRALWPHHGDDAGIVQAGRDAAHARFVAASVDTLRSRRRLESYLQFGTPTLVIVDEAHHSVAPTWVRTLEAVTGDRTYRLGLTATPDRADGRELGGAWQLAYSYAITDAIEDGYLVPPVMRSHLLPDLDLSAVKVTRGGDFDARQLRGALDAAGVVEHTIEAMNDHARDRRSMVFCASVQQAKDTAEALQAEGYDARWVSGETPDEDRRRLMRAYMDGSIRVLCNAMVLTEGTDLPPCDCVVMARPTRSRSLYTQAVGRGLRLYPGKDDCIVIDMVGASEEHSLVCAPILLDQIDRAKRETAETEREERERAEAQIAAWKRGKRPKAAWVDVPGLDRPARAVDCGEHGMVAMVADDDREGWSAILVPKRGKPQPIVSSAPEDLARGMCEDVARRASGLTWRGASWRKKPPSAKAIAFLRRIGGTVTRGMTAGDVSEATTAQLAKRKIAKAGAAVRVDRKT